MRTTFISTAELVSHLEDPKLDGDRLPLRAR